MLQYRFYFYLFTFLQNTRIALIDQQVYYARGLFSKNPHNFTEISA